MDNDYDDYYGEKASTPACIPSLTPAKKIYVYRNGDSYFGGKQVLVNQRYTRTWNAFLEQLNMTFLLNTGAVQRIHTPRQGHVVRDFSELENGASYVVAGPERFRRMNYDDIRVRNLNPPKSRKKELLFEISVAKPVVHSRIQVEPKVNLMLQPKSLWFYRNGDTFSKPLLILFKPRQLTTWEQLLRTISEKIVLKDSMAIRRIFKLSGEEIVHVDQLENNEFYVVAGNDRFIGATYGNIPPNLLLATPRNKPFGKVKYLAHLPTPPHQDSFGADSEKGKSFYETMRTTRTHRRKLQKRIVPIDYDQDASGMFRASQPHLETREAQQVHEESLHRVATPPPQETYQETEDHDGRSRQRTGRKDRTSGRTEKSVRLLDEHEHHHQHDNEQDDSAKQRVREERKARRREKKAAKQAQKQLEVQQNAHEETEAEKAAREEQQTRQREKKAAKKAQKQREAERAARDLEQAEKFAQDRKAQNGQSSKSARTERSARKSSSEERPTSRNEASNTDVRHENNADEQEQQENNAAQQEQQVQQENNAAQQEQQENNAAQQEQQVQQENNADEQEQQEQ